MDGLEAPSRRARPLRHHRPARWPPAPALHHEENGQGPHLGVDPCPHRPRNPLAFLGSPRRRPLARTALRLPRALRKNRRTRHRPQWNPPSGSMRGMRYALAGRPSDQQLAAPERLTNVAITKDWTKTQSRRMAISLATNLRS